MLVIVEMERKEVNSDRKRRVIRRREVRDIHAPRFVAIGLQGLVEGTNDVSPLDGQVVRVLGVGRSVGRERC